MVRSVKAAAASAGHHAHDLRKGIKTRCGRDRSIAMHISSETIPERTGEGPGQPEGEAAHAHTRQRKIIHIDMDAFYASVEQRDNPELRGKPVAVGYGQARGVVAAASYEARKFGVYSALPSVTAKRKCPELIFVMPRFDVYKSVSREIHESLTLNDSPPNLGVRFFL